MTSPRHAHRARRAPRREPLLTSTQALRVSTGCCLSHPGGPIPLLAVAPRKYKGRSVVAPDLIGFGWSDKPRAYDYSIIDQATLCEGLLRELGAERVHVLAHDYGDSVAQELLARHEERDSRGTPALQSVCFLNGGLFPEGTSRRGTGSRCRTPTSSSSPVWATIRRSRTQRPCWPLSRRSTTSSLDARQRARRNLASACLDPSP